MGQQRRAGESVYPADGTIAQMEGVAIIKGGPNTAGARKFVDYVNRKDVREMILKQTFRRPARQDLDLPNLPGKMPRLSRLKLVKYDEEGWTAKRGETMDRIKETIQKTRGGSAPASAGRDHRSRGWRAPFGTVRAIDDVSLAVARRRVLHAARARRAAARPRCCAWSPASATSTRGRILFGERRIDTLPPHRRNAGMVFQNYAIFPNHTVGGNVAYGLKARNVRGRRSWSAASPAR